MHTHTNFGTTFVLLFLLDGFNGEIFAFLPVYATSETKQWEIVGSMGSMLYINHNKL